MLIEINDITAPELDVFARLTEAQLRSRLEPEKGVFIAESPKVITTAVENGYRPVSFLMERRHAAGDAAALGVDAILATPTCCDPFCRRAVRVSMGTVFQVPWTYIGDAPGDWPERGIARLRALGFRTAAMALTDDSVSIEDEALMAEPKLAIVLGTEGDGLAHTTIAACDYTVKIPMSHKVDSLNVAAAGALAFWQLRAR